MLNSALFIFSLQGGALRRTALLIALLAASVFSDAAVSADSKAISPDSKSQVYESQTLSGIELRLLDVASGKSKSLVRLPGDNRWPVWSPDGHFIAFFTTFKGHHYLTVTDITGHSWLVTEVLGNPSHVTWSPDAVWLVFASEVTPGNSDLFIASAGGTDLQNLTKSPNISESDPIWLPKANRIAFQYHEVGATTVKQGELSWPLATH